MMQTIMGNSNAPKASAKNPLGALAGAYQNNPELSSLLQQLSKGEEDANNANLAQYGNLMGAVKSMNRSVNAGLENIGVEGKNRIAETEKRDLGNNVQDAMNKGLGNTTITNSLNNTTKMQSERARQELDSNLGQQRANAALQVGGLNMNAILSRVNEGPHIDQYLGLIQSLMHNGAMGPTMQTSTMGSVTAANGLRTGQGVGGGPQGQSGGQPGEFVAPRGGGTLPLYGGFGADQYSRPGDVAFGGSSPAMTAAGYQPGVVDGNSIKPMGGQKQFADADFMDE